MISKKAAKPSFDDLNSCDACFAKLKIEAFAMILTVASQLGYIEDEQSDFGAMLFSQQP